MNSQRNLSLLAALFGFVLLGQASEVAAQAPKGGPPPLPQKVLVWPAVEDEVSDQRSFVGNVKPVRRSIVGSAVPGRVEKFPVNEGDYVEAGAPIAQLRRGVIEAELNVAKGQLAVREAELKELEQSLEDEKAQAQARLDNAEAQLAFRQAKVERARALGTSIARELLEEELAAAIAAEATRREAKAALNLLIGPAREQKTNVIRGWVAAQTAEVERLTEQVERHTMFAPFSGYVTAEHTEVGQWVMQGDPVAEIVELDKVDIEIFVLEDFIGYLNSSIQYEVAVNSLPQEQFQGEIALIVPQADARTRSFPVKIRVQNKMHNNQPLLKAGMLAHVELPVSEKARKTLVPKDAVVHGGAAPVVYVASAEGDKSQVRMTPVGLGSSHGVWIAVTGEIQPGELVVVEGNERIRPGQPVRAVKKEVAYP